MLADGELIGFVGTTDLARARGFYADVLGLRLVERTDFACVFDAHGTMLRVTPVPELNPAGYTVLGWRVADLAATVTELAARGVAFSRFPGMAQDAAGVWTTPGGDRIAWFHDPDGNTLSLTQFA